ncbi:hypothetical protein [Vibrio campbellii]|uniref:hypothetical protein n=1 Tax=Vibrio campbellii TaxID=680 RepID=UPI000A2F98DC|nr:UTP--glucose-1-phosphate uridylyltransferase [Vibrio campbellii]
MPKKMVPVVNKLLIECGVEESIHADMTDMCLLINRIKYVLMLHFDKSYEIEYQIFH